MRAAPAHLALGRLDQALADPQTRRLWTMDALRREVLASRSLDGELVSLEDLATARLHCSGVIRSDIAGALDLLLAGERLLGLGEDATEQRRELDFRLRAKTQRALLGEPDPVPADDDPSEDLADLGDPDGPPLPLSETEARAAAQASITECRAGVRASVIGVAEAVPTPEAPSPLSADWLALVWAQVVGAPDAETMQRLEHAAALIDVSLQQPGLHGALAALWSLQQADPRDGQPSPRYPQIRDHDPALADALELAAATSQRTPPEWSMARLILPWLIQRSCDLPLPGPWLSLAISQLGGRGIYQSAQQMSQSAWVSRMMGVAADGLAAELLRIDTLRMLIATWADKLASGKARVAGKTIDVLQLILDQPVMNSKTLAKRRGVKTRMAQLQLGELVRAGVMTETTGQYAERIYFVRGM